MTSLLAPGLVTGSAPPANGPPGWGTTGDTGAPTDPKGSFAALLTAAQAVLQGGETATPPTGGTPSSPMSEPTAADLLAALIALAQGAHPPDPGAPDEAKTDLSLLDRPAGAGEDHSEDGPALEPGAAEALMALLAMGGALLQRTEDAATAMPSLDVDARELIVAVEAAARAAATGAGTGVQAGAEPAQGVVSPVAVDQALKDAGLAPTGEGDLAAAAPEEGMPQGLSPESAAGAADTATTTTGSDATDASLVGGARAETQREPGDALGHGTMVPAGEGERPQSSTTQVDGVVVRTAGDGLQADQSAASAAGMGAVAPPVTPSRVAEVVTATAPVDDASLPAALVDTVQGAVLRGDSEVRLVLNPPELGHLDIRIATHEGGLRVSLEASQSGARELLERSLPLLQQGLEARDLRVDRLEIRATDTGRGSLDSSGTGQQSSGGQEGAGDGRPEWSAVASLGLGDARDAGVVTSSRQTAGDGRLDVMA